MAPEIIEVAGATTVSDIWSLGCTIVEMLRGTPPYFELVTMQALFKIVEDACPPIPATFSEEVKSFLQKYCFVKDIKKRSTAEQLLKTPWVSKNNGVIYDYNQICSIIKGSTVASATAKPKSRITSAQKYPSSGSPSSSIPVSASSKYPSSGLKVSSGSIADGVGSLDENLPLKLQLEIEFLCKEQIKLQKELDLLLINNLLG